MNRIAIIGSGITGISVAFHQNPNTHITMFDKSRRPGGRVSTRTSRDHPGYSFDHGAPFITARGQFLQMLTKINAVREISVKQAQMQQNGLLKTCEKKYLGGNPSIETIPLKLLEELKKRHVLDYHFNTRITSILEDKEKYAYKLICEETKQFGPFHQVYVCIPYPQCLSIKQDIVKFEDMPVVGSFYNGTWVALIALQNNNLSKTLMGVDVCFNISPNIESIVNQQKKGNSSEQDLWVITMKQDWSQKNINLKAEQVEKEVQVELRQILKEEMKIKFMKAHRWLYSKPKNTPNKPLKGKSIVMGGDWVGRKTNTQECWQLGQLLVKTMNIESSSL